MSLVVDSERKDDDIIQLTDLNSATNDQPTRTGIDLVDDHCIDTFGAPNSDVESEENSDDGDSIERVGWDSKADFILVCIGYAVGLGNIWRFPYLCYKNGGGAFLIPYTICLIFIGIPMFYLELGFGQYLQLGGLRAWEVIPVFKGVGYGATTIACMMNIYYIVILSWTLIYLACSFSPTLPWSICDGWWNDIHCYDSKTMNTTNNGTEFLTGEYSNITMSMEVAETPAEQYWNNFVLQISDGIEHIEGIVWPLAVSLLVAWILTYICIVKGIRTTGKIVWFTTTFPYVIITILLIRAVTLPGAGDGIYFYLVPDMERLKDAQVWVDAGSQILFSLAVGFTSLISLGSYNKYHNNILIDTLVVCLVNCLTSFYTGFMIFAILGYMAWDQGKEVHDVVDDGPGLTFIAVPTAIAEMPGSNFWAICFFVMILMLGLDSQFCVVEGFYTCIADEYPRIFRRYRPQCLAIVCILYYFLALPCITHAGMYFFTLMDGWGASGYVLLWSTLSESFVICYVWGIKYYMRAISDMLGYTPCYGWPICWCVITPLLLIFILIFSFGTYSGAYYEGYKYPLWGEVLGWLMAAVSMHWILTYLIYGFIVTPGTFKERWQTGLHPPPYLTLRGQTNEIEADDDLEDSGEDTPRYTYNDNEILWRDIEHLPNNINGNPALSGNNKLEIGDPVK